MAIGGTYNGNSSGEGKKQLYENTYYSRIRIKNDEAKLALGFSYRSGLLCAEISEIKEGFQYEALESAYISPTKAALLVRELKAFKYYLTEAEEKITPNKAFGVTTGMGEKISYIGFHANEDKKLFVTIGKFDGSGNIINSVTIPLNSEYHFAVEWDDINSMENLSKVYYESIELDQMLQMFEDFARCMTGALAYSVVDLAKFDIAGIKGKMDPIYDKLGIEKRSYNGNKSYGTNDFLSNAGKATSKSTSFDDIESSFED